MLDSPRIVPHTSGAAMRRCTSLLLALVPLTLHAQDKHYGVIWSRTPNWSLTQKVEDRPYVGPRIGLFALNIAGEYIIGKAIQKVMGWSTNQSMAVSVFNVNVTAHVWYATTGRYRFDVPDVVSGIILGSSTLLPSLVERDWRRGVFAGVAWTGAAALAYPYQSP